MKIINILVVIALIFSATSEGMSQDRTYEERRDSVLCPEAKAAIGKLYPKFILTDGQNELRNSDLLGKVVFINFWFEGCHPCMDEMSALNSLYNKLNDIKEFIFLSVSFDSKETIASVKRKFGLNFDSYSVDRKESIRMNMGCGYPSCFILDKEGIVRFRMGGPSSKSDIDNYFTDYVYERILGLLDGH